jgi:thioredoxin-related protein
MDFKTKFIFVLSLTLGACGSNKQDTTPTIGQELTQYSEIVNLGASSDLLVVDNQTQYVNKFSLTDLSLKSSYRLESIGEKHFLAASSSQKYFLDFSKRHLDIIKSDGSKVSRPFSFVGTPTSAAFQATVGMLAMLDSKMSIGMMSLADDGTVKKSWLSGSVTQSGESIFAGDILATGKLAVSVGDTKLMIADVEQSMTNQSWVAQEMTQDLGKIIWVSPLQQSTKHVFVASASKIAVIDIDAKQIVERSSITDGAGHFSKRGTPHVMYVDASGNLQFFYVSSDLKIVNKTLPSWKQLTTISASYFNGTTSQVTLVINDYFKGLFLVTFRLTDGLWTQENAVSDAPSVIPGDQSVLVNYENPLGHLQFNDYAKGTRLNNEGFNLNRYLGR